MLDTSEEIKVSPKSQLQDVMVHTPTTLVLTKFIVSLGQSVSPAKDAIGKAKTIAIKVVSSLQPFVSVTTKFTVWLKAGAGYT